MIRRLLLAAVTIIVIATANSNVLPATAQQQPIDVGVIERPPFATKQDDAWSGFSIELIEEIAERKNLSINFKEETVFATMLDNVRSGSSDLAAANISVTSEREQTLDFSNPIYDSGLQIFVPAGSQSTSYVTLLWQSGIVQLLIVAFAILMIVAHLMWWFERDHGGQDYFRDDYLGGIWDAFWWAFIIVTIGGFENERPERPIGRVLAVFWILASIFFISTFTARITTSLTVAQLQSDISTFEDLRGRSVGAAKGTSIASFLDRQNINYQQYDDFSQVIEAVENETLEAGVGDAPVVQFYAANDGQGKIVTAGEVFADESLAFAFPENSQWYEVINQGLIELKEDGTFQEILNTYFGE